MRALHWRITAGHLWSPGLQQAMHSSVQGLKGKDAINAAKAKRAAIEVHDLLFPKDEPDGS